ncbi:hypothetical protein Veis_1754 [Verminephrobacter eiseniae EF01-2]|uniref:Uncharacterized protein n=1 Tax=Verminephrobacter eiseniae (strain EF01-2) TaxID=391735 RepID=A1WIQ1_VEREI|nr:hypothetical protein Veis_1754 [Verminephrobacter eiseniae EF01-2]
MSAGPSGTAAAAPRPAQRERHGACAAHGHRHRADRSIPSDPAAAARAAATIRQPGASTRAHGSVAVMSIGFVVRAKPGSRPLLSALRLHERFGNGIRSTPSRASVASRIRCRRLRAAIGAQRKAHRAAHTELYWQAMQRRDALRWPAQTDR